MEIPKNLSIPKNGGRTPKFRVENQVPSFSRSPPPLSSVENCKSLFLILLQRTQLPTVELWTIHLQLSTHIHPINLLFPSNSLHLAFPHTSTMDTNCAPSQSSALQTTPLTIPPTPSPPPPSPHIHSPLGGEGSGVRGYRPKVERNRAGGAKDPLTRPAPAGENAGGGPPSPPRSPSQNSGVAEVRERCWA